MAQTLDPINFGIITPIRRIRSMRFETVWDESTTPPTTRVHATFDYEVIYTDADGKQVCPSRHDGFVSLGDAQARALPDFPSAFTALLAAGDAAKEAQSAPAPPPPGENP